MLNPFKAFKLHRERKKMLDIQQFAHHHRRYLVIVADPQDDTLFMSYGGQQVASKIKTVDGKEHEVVKRVLRYSTFQSQIDRFLGALIDALHTPIEHFSDFGKWIDGALYNISRSLDKGRKEADPWVNKTMMDIVEQNDWEMYRRHKYKFTGNERKYIESKLNNQPADPTATKSN